MSEKSPMLTLALIGVSGQGARIETHKSASRLEKCKVGYTPARCRQNRARFDGTRLRKVDLLFQCR
jgi:hypothetical protein